MFLTSPQTEILDAALALVQGEIVVAAKDANNTHLNSKYANLASIWKACRPALVKHGISVTQWPVNQADDNRLHLITRLALGGQWMLAQMVLPADKQSPQGFGSAITYAKKYALAAAVGVIADEDEADDDGETAEREHERYSRDMRPAQNPLDAEDPYLEEIRSCWSKQEFAAMTKRLGDDPKVHGKRRQILGAAFKAQQAEANKPCPDCGGKGEHRAPCETK